MERNVCTSHKYDVFLNSIHTHRFIDMSLNFIKENYQMANVKLVIVRDSREHAHPCS